MSQTLLPEREVLDTTWIEERERAVEAPPTPPRRPRFVRWLEWAAALMAVVLVAVTAALIFRGEPVAEHLVDDALSELSIGPRHLDPDFSIEPRWIGVPLEGTLEELEAARIDAGVAPGVFVPTAPLEGAVVPAPLPAAGPGVSGGPLGSAVEPVPVAVASRAPIERAISAAELARLQAGNVYSTYESRWLLPERGTARPIDTSIGYYDTTLSTWVFAEPPVTPAVPVTPVLTSWWLTPTQGMFNGYYSSELGTFVPPVVEYGTAFTGGYSYHYGTFIPPVG